MYDAIVIGARCAGSTTAMLLARSGLRVLLVDRAPVGSELPHGHFVYRHGPARLARWGLLESVVATNCPAVTVMTTDFGDCALTGRDLAVDGVPIAVAPRHGRLDAVLAAAAVAAGAELRDRFAVLELTGDGERVTGIVGRDARSGARVTERARVVIGADGRNSGVARTVGAQAYVSAPTLTCWYFSYYGDLPAAGLELYVRPGSAIFVFPTNDGLTGVFVGFARAELARVKRDPEAAMLAAVDAIAGLGERLRAARRAERLFGASQLPNFLRASHGPGWALVGDAGCHKDPFMALGICDALRDAEALATALADALTGGRDEQEALAGYVRARDEATLPDYHLNLALAQFGPLPESQLRLRAALHGNQAATDHFFLATQGTVDPQTFFNEENIGRIMAGAAAAG